MSSKIFSDRIDAVFYHWAQKKLDAILIEKPIDLFYLTGINLSAGALFISHGNAHLLVDGRYIEIAKKTAPCSCGLTSPQNFKKVVSPFSCLGFDSSATSYQRWQELKEIFKERLLPLKRPTEPVRAIKSVAEIKSLKKSAALLWKGYQHLRKSLKIGVAERELACRFEIFCLEHGAEKMAFDPIVAFGKNSAFPHHRSGNSRLKKREVVLLDLGVVVDHYNSDMTRTEFYGKPHARLIPVKDAVTEAHDAALFLCRPGVKVGELDNAARQVIEKAGLDSYLAHSLGHGVGLEVHEFPRLKYQGEDHDVILREGMVITIEPGLYLPGIGGFRFEDTIVVTKKGYENWYF